MTKQKSIHGPGTEDDPKLRKRLLKMLDDLERLNDWVGDRGIRHKVSECVVEARKAVNGGVPKEQP